MTKKSEKRESIMSYAYQPAIKEIVKGLSLLMMRLKADGKEFLLTESAETDKLPIEVTVYIDFGVGYIQQQSYEVKGIRVTERGDLFILTNVDAVRYTEEDVITEFNEEESTNIHCLLKDGELFTGDETIDSDLAALALLRTIDEYYS